MFFNLIKKFDLNVAFPWPATRRATTSPLPAHTEVEVSFRVAVAPTRLLSPSPTSAPKPFAIAADGASVLLRLPTNKDRLNRCE
ncbi:hypothetical protein GUJ93_ZPchr0006g41824 [Zizania palustris]|uniref:Uncharacterized protein n=1 Tax=Zizania palustris TaxID=103762 RepID=A0A8J5SW33_ZIZPA|nr:hypothetical protein GUJ93_ZPchr0006g41824 [Zizania palustris]